MWKARGSPRVREAEPERGAVNLEEVLRTWAAEERALAVPDLWPRLRPALYARPAPHAKESPERRVAVSLAAALGATYVVGPLFHASVSQLVAWVGGAGPALLLGSWERWWQLLVRSLFG